MLFSIGVWIEPRSQESEGGEGLDTKYFLGWVRGYTRSNDGDLEKCHILELYWFPDVETLEKFMKANQLAQTLAPK